MNSPLVSVIIPNYNYAHFLDERINSVLNQTYNNIEVIILDDNSSDDSRTVIEKYRHDNKIAHIIYNKTNSGSTFKQWHKGFEYVKGEFIWIAEADDYADIHLLEKLINTINNDESIQIGFVNSYWVFPNRVFINQDYTIKEQMHIYNGVSFVRKHLLKENYIYNASMAIFRRKALMGINNDYMNFRSCGDKLFWKSLAIQGNVLFVCEPLNYFRIHNSKVTTNAIATGLLFEEENHFFHLNIKDGIIKKSFDRMDVIGYFLKYIENTKKDFISEEVYYRCKNLWLKECDYRNTQLPLLFRVACFMKSLNKR